MSWQFCTLRHGCPIIPRCIFESDPFLLFPSQHVAMGSRRSSWTQQASARHGHHRRAKGRGTYHCSYLRLKSTGIATATDSTCRSGSSDPRSHGRCQPAILDVYAAMTALHLPSTIRRDLHRDGKTYLLCWQSCLPGLASFAFSQQTP